MEDVLVKLQNLVNEMHSLLNDYRSSIVQSEPMILPEPYEVITPEQEDEIRYLCRDYPEMIQEMLDRLRLDGLEFMPKKEYRLHIERLRKIIDARKKIPH